MRLPSFIIAGAMKCGTTSLRSILAHHPSIYIPDHEIFYFALDDIQQHPHFFGCEEGRWLYHDVEGRRDFYLAWYAEFFAAARGDQIVGENSTSYIASTRAPKRIASLLPEVKMIVMLRDPVHRAYSHYWHLVRAGRTGASFEDCLRFAAPQVVERSCYRHQVERLLREIPRARVQFVIFETFISAMEDTAAEVLRFLGVPPVIDLTQVNTRRNAGRYPQSVRLELLRNRLLGGPSEGIPLHLPDIGLPRGRPGGVRGWVSQIARRVNPRVRAAPPMRPETKRFLTEHLRRENRGLSELVDQDVDRLWWKD